MNKFKYHLLILYSKLNYFFKNKLKKRNKIKSIIKVKDNIFIINNTFILNKNQLDIFNINNVKLLKFPFQFVMITNDGIDITYLFENFIKISEDINLTFNDVFNIFNINPIKIELFDNDLNIIQLSDYNQIAL